MRTFLRLGSGTCMAQPHCAVSTFRYLQLTLILKLVSSVLELRQMLQLQFRFCGGDILSNQMRRQSLHYADLPLLLLDHQAVCTQLLSAFCDANPGDSFQRLNACPPSDQAAGKAGTSSLRDNYLLMAMERLSHIAVSFLLPIASAVLFL